jgi:putative transposase
VSEKYEFIDGSKYAYPIVRMCAWLEVSKSGFYDWRDRPASATAQRRAALTDLIVEIFDDSDETYGLPAGARRAGPPGRRGRP